MCGRFSVILSVSWYPSITAQPKWKLAHLFVNSGSWATAVIMAKSAEPPQTFFTLFGNVLEYVYEILCDIKINFSLLIRVK